MKKNPCATSCAREEEGGAPADNRVLLALSGGVDSSVAVRLLQQAGYAVEGLVISFSPAHAPAVAAATVAAKELGIPLAVAHCEERFAREVIEPFCEAYCAGRTPNPCVLCNPAVKFAVLAEEADRMGIRRIATGHYAQVAWRDGIATIAQAKSLARDQSYMLYRLPQSILTRLVLPCGAYEKPEVRRMAGEAGLTSAKTPDSQEICFIPDGDYPAFLHRRGCRGRQGRFLAPDGRDVGAHRGVEHYTIGQRRGLGIALGQPLFVRAILPNGDIQLGLAGEEFSAGVELTDVVTTDGKPLQPGAAYDVKIRSAAAPVPCTVAENPDTLRFGTPQRAPAPGQHAVLYRGGLVMGGGVIAAVI